MAIPARRTSTSPSSTQWSQHRHEQSLPDSNRDTKERTMGAEMWQAYAQMVACVETAASRLNARHGDEYGSARIALSVQSRTILSVFPAACKLAAASQSLGMCASQCAVAANLCQPRLYARTLRKTSVGSLEVSLSTSAAAAQQKQQNEAGKHRKHARLDPSSSRKRTPGMSSLSSSGFKIVGRPINCQHGICQRIALKMWASRCDPFDFSRFTRVCPAKRNSHSAAKRNHLQNPYRQLCDFPPQQSHHLMHGPRHARHLIFTRGEHSDDLGARVHPL